MRKAEFLSAVGVGFAVLVAYCLTLYPSVPGGDSGEIIGAVATEGVIHPPGYPLFSLLGRMFLHVPFGSVAWRINLLSAVCGAAAAGVLTAAIVRWTKSVPAGVVAGGLFAFSPGVWQYAICAEVFSLNNLFVALLVLLAVLFSEQRKPSIAFMGAFAWGLGVANHHTIIFTGIPIALWVLIYGRRELLEPRPLLLLVLCFNAGLLPYAALPWLAGHHSFISWGQPETWAGFRTHVLRQEYGTFQLSPVERPDSTHVGQGLAAWSQYLLRDLGWWWLALAAWGLFEWVREGRERRSSLHITLLLPPIVSVAAMALLGNLDVAKPLFREILARFWQQPELYVCIACGFGVFALERALRKRWAGPAAAALVIAAQLGLHARDMNRHTSTLVRSYGSEILRSAPPNALLLTKGDLITNTIRYLQLVEGYRSDVKLIDQELLAYGWYREQVARRYPELPLPPAGPFSNRDLVDLYFGRQPLMICGGLRGGDLSPISGYEFWPYGLCDSVHPASAPPPVDIWFRLSEAALPRVDFAGEARPPGSWEEVVWSDYWEVRRARAVQLITYAGPDPERRPQLEQAAAILEGIRKERPDTPPHLLKTLAITYGRIGLETAEQKARTADVWRSYVAAAPDDPQLPTIEAELQRLTGTAAAVSPNAD